MCRLSPGSGVKPGVLKLCCPEPSHCHPPAPHSGSLNPALTGSAGLAAWLPFLPRIHVVLQVSVTLRAEGHQLPWPSGLARALRARGRRSAPALTFLLVAGAGGPFTSVR